MKTHDIAYRISIGFATGLAVLLCALPATAREAKTFAQATIRYTDPTSVDPVTVKNTIGLKGGELDERFDIEPDTAAAGMGLWIFANNEGRVRNHAQTASDFYIGDSRSIMFWTQIFQQNLTDEQPSYVVNPTFLQYVDGDEALLYIGIFVSCYENLGAAEKGRFLWSRQVLRHNARIGKRRLGDTEFFHAEGRHNGVEIPEGPLPIGERLLIPLGSQANGIVRSTTGTFRGTIEELGDCGLGQYYDVTYILQTRVLDKGRESSATAFVGDPLEPDSGFEFEPTSPDADTPPQQYCASGSDLTRFGDNGDGTISDRHTGLMWQRCPLGSALDDRGTPAELADDVCVDADAATGDWQSALLTAEQTTTAGHADWRLPNIKELESIVELQCLVPAIQPEPFPDTPLGAFWSATPDLADGMSAKTVSSALGEVGSTAKSTEAYTRLVRDSGDQPLLPLIAVEVGRARASAEGDPGSANELVFPLRLARPAEDNVSVSYATADRSATAGEDYVETSGTLIIPSGESSGEVVVPLIGDDIAEEGEVVELLLTSTSANAVARIASALGQIDDDEPVVTVAQADAYEGDAGTTALTFTVTASAPATTEIVFEYGTIDDTATIADGDYVPVSGEAVIPVGQRSTQISISVNGDQRVEGEERLRLQFSAPAGDVARLATEEVYGYIIEDDRGLMEALNDTGVNRCANEFNGFTSCPQAGYPGQDAEFGRDAALSDDTDGLAGLSFTKLDASGTPLADQGAAYDATPWDCVQDEVTGLAWEVKTTDGGLRDRDSLFSWYNSTGRNDGGDPGTEDGGTCNVAGQCDTEKYVAAVNAAGLCGYDDWRMPSRDELLSIVINQRGINMSLDENYFPNFDTSGSLFGWWTGTPASRWPFGGTSFDFGNAWYVFMLGNGSLNTTPKDIPLQVMLVRGRITPN
jgi:hypothetical protein